MDLRHQLQRTLGDGYTLENELEAGGMSRVFVARDEQLGRKVVVKTLADDSGVSVSAERFRREIRLAASLQQANIVPVHSAGDVDGVPYYTMPYVEGESLRAHLDKRGALDVRETVNILRDVARALAFAHERGVVHRDIKPENILLSGSTAVVTDFGIAKAIEASHSMAGATTLTQLGTLLGTPAYISPEQAAGDPHVDHLADIYSLGVVAYEMLAGARPFTVTSARALLAAHVNEAPPPIATRRDGLPPRLASLVMRCLEKEPGKRPQRAGDLLDALETALAAGAPVATALPSIAVLPFANMSPDPADEFFADGLTDEIITDLSGIKSLRVIARAAMMRYKGTEKEPATIAREVRVRYVLDGSVRRAGDSMRLTARLLDTDTDSTVWSDKLSGKVEDVFEMQERVSRTIVDALKLKLSPREERRLADRPIEDLRAYEAYLQARQAMWNFGPESLARARELLQFAISRVGENPILLSALGGVAIHAISAGGADTKREAETAEDCARRLAVIAPESFGRYALQGILHWRKGEMREAIATLSKAHEREPGDVEVVAYLQYSYLMAGRDDRAREISKLVVELDPVTPLMQVMPPFCDLMAGRAREVLGNYAEFASREPLNPLAQFWLLSIRAEGGDIPGMRECARDLVARWPQSEFGMAGRLTLELLDNPAAAATLAVPPELRAICSESESIARSAAWLFGRLGAHDAALDALEDAIARGLAHYPHLARDCQSLEGVRGHPRFQRLLAVVRERWERGGTSAEDLAEDAAVKTPPSTERKSVAVLPFANLSPDPENEFFADGITDDLIAQVAKISSLRVIARTSVMRYRGEQDAARTAAKELGVGAVVEGTVRRAGKRARIVAQLIDASSNAPIWTETYDRDLDDVFSVQTEVATSVAGALRATLTPAEQARLTGAPAVDAATYDAYLLGRHHWNKRTDESIRTAIRYFEQCIARSPRFAPGHAGLADAYLFAALGYATMNMDQAFAAARRAAEAAIAIDPESPEGLCALANCAMHYDWNLAEARRLLRRAISQNPNFAAANQWLAWTHFYDGQYLEAVKAQELALELDPLSVTLITESSWPFLYAGLWDSAGSRLQRALELEPTFPLAHYDMGLVHHGKGQFPEAFAAYEVALAGMGRVGWVLAWIALAHIQRGESHEAERLLKELERQSLADNRALLWVAFVHDALGNGDQALDALERAAGVRSTFIAGIANEGWIPFATTRITPRFQALCRKLGLTPHDIPRQRELLLEHARKQGLV
jgi:TolB-like protein/Flp pilus assembly protein TadD